MANGVREEVLNLMNKKAKIEDEIKSLGIVLQQNGVGMSEPLVDPEGFPLANVDVYQVRIARNRIICLQNDYKALLREIENGLTDYYGSHSSGSESSSHQTPMDSVSLLTKPFARVNDVTEGSPADEAGLRFDDLIVEFGSVNADNFKDMGMIANVVKHSENNEILLRVERLARLMSVKLRPHKWTGRGLLGCVIVPLEFIDR